MIRKIVKLINLAAFYIYNRIASVILKINKKKAVFLSESHRELDGNLKCVYDALPSDIEKKVHIKGDRRTKENLLETFSIWYDMTTSGIILLDDFYGLTSAIKARKGQQIVQLWHGSGAYKKFGYSRQNTGDKIERVHSGYKKYTMAITSSEDIRGCYAEAFGIDISKVVATGIPRTDIFFDEKKKKEISERFFKEYPDLKDKKIVLFAPTYRGRKVEDADYDFEYANLDLLTEELGDGYAVITKWHPALRNNIERNKVQAKHCSKVKDFSYYRDMNELLIVCDILVTDYSSIIFDYSLLNKPIVYFAYDIDSYAENRGLYFQFNEYVYGNVVEKRNSLVKAIINGNLCIENRMKFNDKFMLSCAGISTNNVITCLKKRY